MEWQRTKGKELLGEASKNKETGEVTNEEASVLNIRRDLERLLMNTNKPRNKLKRSNLIGSATGARHVGLLGWLSRHVMHCELAFFMTSLAFQHFDWSMKEWSLNFKDFLVQNAETLS